MKGFEPLRRCRPTAFRVRTLQPLGYISKFFARIFSLASIIISYFPGLCKPQNLFFAAITSSIPSFYKNDCQVIILLFLPTAPFYLAKSLSLNYYTALSSKITVAKLLYCFVRLQQLYNHHLHANLLIHPACFYLLLKKCAVLNCLAQFFF